MILLSRYLRDQIEKNPKNGQSVKRVLKQRLYSIEKVVLILESHNLINNAIDGLFDLPRFKSLGILYL